MSKQDDLKYLQSEINSKTSGTRVTNNYNELNVLSNGQSIMIYLNKGDLNDVNSTSSDSPANDEIGLYAKFEGRIFKISMSEVL